MSVFHRVTLGCLIGLTMTATVHAAPSSNDLMGTWYSEQQQDDETMKWLTRRMDNNRYAALFLVCNGKDLSWVQKETGDWQLENGELVENVSSMEDMNGKKQVPEGKTVTQTYTALNLNGDVLAYQKKGTDKQFEFNRVEDGYQIRCD